jgi:hypothetical protein
MDLREWLAMVGARNGAGSVVHYRGFAQQVRKDFPRLPLTEDLAVSVGASLGGQFPSWEDLRGAIKAAMSEQPAASAPTYQPRMLTPAEREAEDDRIDREWWEDRIGRVSRLTTATEAWREATGMLATLTRPDAHPRPWAIKRLRAIIANTAEAGADTDRAMVRFPREVKITPPPVKREDAA